MESNKILILDDEQPILSSLTDFFEDEGWIVIPFLRAEKALEFLKNEKMDFASVDLRLPGINGIEFTKKALATNPKMSIVIYSGSLDFEITDELKELNLSINNYISKPVKNLQEILDRLLLLNNQKNTNNNR